MSETIDLSSLRLARGSHATREGGMCLMEAVAWVAGEPHSDEPACACPVLAAFGRAWNDALDDADRQRLLAPYVPRLVGTRSTPEVEQRRAYMALDWLVRVYTPAWLDLQPELAEHAEVLRALPEIVDLATAKLAGGPVSAAECAAVSAAGIDPEIGVESAARSAARAAAAPAAGAAAWFAAESAAWSAESAAWSAESAAWAAAWAAVAAAWFAAGAALQPTVEHLQASAVELLDRMISAQPEVSRD